MLIIRALAGLLKDLQANYVAAVGSQPAKRDENSDSADLGDVKVDWSVQGQPMFIRQFNVEWHCHADGSVQKKIVGPEVRSCSIPVQHYKYVPGMC